MTQCNLNDTAPLKIADFDSFYKAIYGFSPFRWQSRLAREVCEGCWPDYLKLPTSSGKTAAIDIAVFALAYQACAENRPAGVASAARRIFFVVDRRIIVNEAYSRATKLATRLWEALAAQHPDMNAIELRVAKWLQSLTASNSAPPLDCFELRGGIYRNDAWVRSPLQPTVLTSTVDQVGSRMLFRGYGVSDRNLPIHASLTTHDSLVILDEAHCSRPFSQTLESIKRYRTSRWAEHAFKSPFSLVQMTATPPVELGKRTVFSLADEDYQSDRLLEQRHTCVKPTRLVLATAAKGRSLPQKIASQLVIQATELADRGCKKIAIVVNRVAIARLVFEALGTIQRKQYENDRWLMIGRMRPIDRDKLTEEIQSRFGSGIPFRHDGAQFVVATQCLEVGADLNFDGMVTQCASLDALRQRFGRLNRLGDAPQSQGVIVAAEGDVPELNKLKDDSPHDPVYGNALARTWHWLNSVSAVPVLDVQPSETDEVAAVEESASVVLRKEVDFGICALDQLIEAHSVDAKLSAPAPDAPVLMPAHLDMLCQTTPRPQPEPNVAAYLHGTDAQLAEVRVCWRADLRLEPSIEESSELWTQAVAACPPTTAELLSVPLWLLKKWLNGESVEDLTSDVLGEAETPDDFTAGSQSNQLEVKKRVLVWRGARSDLNQNNTKSKRGTNFVVDYRSLKQLKRDDTIVIPVEYGGWSTFGYVPQAPDDPAAMTEQAASDKPLVEIDVADVAFGQSRAKSILRVHAKLADVTDEDSKVLFDVILSRLIETKTLDTGVDVSAIRQLVMSASTSAELPPRLSQLLNDFQKLEFYPDGAAWSTCIHRELIGGVPKLPLASFDDDETLLETSKLSLFQHLADVQQQTKLLTENLDIGKLALSLIKAAALHDIGKADPRFQAMLLNKPLSVAWMQRKLWAKSDKRGENHANELPVGFRHEMLSLNLLDRFALDDTVDRSLIKHLLTSHHGYGCPFSPVWEDSSPPGFGMTGFAVDPVADDERLSWTPAWQLDSGVSERFWRTTRRFGWWGAAWLQTLLRLADWNASANPNCGDVDALDIHPLKTPPMALAHKNSAQPPLVLNGSDGSKPLGYLAALGVFRTLALDHYDANYRFYWLKQDGAWRPAIECDSGQLEMDGLVQQLSDALTMPADTHPALQLLDSLAGSEVLRRTFFQSTSVAAKRQNRSDADWLSCLASDAADTAAISQLQTSRRDYHAIAVKGLLELTTDDHLRKTLFYVWNYSDPIAGVSLHLEPREDRRHAYQWHTPSGDPTRKIYGGMVGANRLALEAWPLFQSLPSFQKDRLVTVGFLATHVSNTHLIWPIWSTPIDLATISSLLAHSAVMDENASKEMRSRGIVERYHCNRILVGKTPNLTPAQPVAVNV